MLILMVGFLYAGDTLSIKTYTGGKVYGWHVGFYYNGEYIPDTEVVGMHLFDLVDAMYKNRMLRPIVTTARDYPFPCGPGPWTFIYGDGLTVVNPDGTEELIPPGTIITAINEAGVCSGMGKIEGFTDTLGNRINKLKFTCVYANDDWETKKTGRITGFRGGDIYHLYIGEPGRVGYKTTEEFVFKTGFEVIEISKLTLWINK